MYLEKSRADWRMTLTNKTPYAMGNKDEGVGRSVTSYSVACETVDKTHSVTHESMRRFYQLGLFVYVVSVGKNPSVG